MSEPYTNESAEILRIKAEIDAGVDETFLTKTAPLIDADFMVIGKLIQIYGYADLNGRRIIDLIKRASVGDHAQNAGLLQDTQVIEKLGESVVLLPPGNVRDGLIKAVTTLKMHVSLRHQFAHWATRRVKGFDVLIMFTMKSKEAEKAVGHSNLPETMTFGLLPLGPMRKELIKLEGHSKYLAETAAHIAVDFEELKKYFDDQKAANQKAKYEAGKLKNGAKGPPMP